MSLITMPNTPPCTDASASKNADTKPRRPRRESSPYPGSSLISRINRRFQSLTSPSRSSLVAGADQNNTTTTSSVDESSRSQIPHDGTQKAENENGNALDQQTASELEDLQQRYQEMQAELARYRERCEELEELCRDFQVTFLSNYLESQKVEGEVRDVLQSSEMRWLGTTERNRGGGDSRRE